ncbi:hypothetical protein Mapa_012640 [Marchantia paleacea]|nr:hypothetical protein Mapa_012640 [Marchantia paleacea]
MCTSMFRTTSTFYFWRRSGLCALGMSLWRKYTAKAAEEASMIADRGSLQYVSPVPGPQPSGLISYCPPSVFL